MQQPNHVSAHKMLQKLQPALLPLLHHPDSSTMVPVSAEASRFDCDVDAGKDWHVDGDIGNSPPETGVACLAMLAVDSLLGVVNALMMLTGVQPRPFATTVLLAAFPFPVNKLSGHGMGCKCREG